MVRQLWPVTDELNKKIALPLATATLRHILDKVKFLLGLVRSWLEVALERILRSEPFIYRQIFEGYTQGTTDLTGLMSYISRILREAFNVNQTTIWFYCAEESSLALAYIEGISPFDSLLELPIDLELKHLHGMQRVSTIPESALRQGLMALGIEMTISLNLYHPLQDMKRKQLYEIVIQNGYTKHYELVGIIGLGNSHHRLPPRPEVLHALDWLAGQLALAIKNNHLITDLSEALDKLQLAYQRTIDVQEEERRNLAIELHDDVLSRLTTISMTLHHSRRQLTDNSIRVQAWLDMIEQEVCYLNNSLREITQGLHPTILTDLGLIAALQAYMDSLTKYALSTSSPCAINLTAQGFGEVRIQDQKLERDLYYITRQALDNALKHAQTEQIFIHLRWRDEAVTITVQDMGIGMKKAPELLMGQQGHLGLLSMHERVLVWRGRLNFQSTPGQGTTVYARLPISQPSPNPTHLLAFTRYLSLVAVEKPLNSPQIIYP